MGKMKPTQEEELEDKLAKHHPKFLEAIKDTQPLAYIASFMLVIAAFSTGEFTAARSYAIAAAVVFLFSFIFSFVHKMLSFSLLAVWSYTTTIVGIVLSIFVVWEFSKTVAMVGSAISVSFSLIFIMIFGSSFYKLAMNFKHFLKEKTRSKSALLGHIFLTAESGLLLFIIITGIFDILGVHLIGSGIFPFIIFIMVLLAVVGILLIPKKKSKP